MPDIDRTRELSGSFVNFIARLLEKPFRISLNDIGYKFAFRRSVFSPDRPLMIHGVRAFTVQERLNAIT